MLLGSYAWNFALGLSHIVVPLYAHHLGFSGLELGVLFSLPIVAQLALGLVAGAATDRWGGRSTLLFSCAILTLGGLVFPFSETFGPLLAAQFLLAIGRSLYWPAAQSIASELPGGRGVQLGRLNAVVSVGQISGTAGAGLLMALLGYLPVFVIFSLLCGAALLVSFRLPAGRAQAAKGGLFQHFGPLLRLPPIWLALLCAFLCAQPVSLGQSFYPLLLQSLDFGSGQIGPLLALRPLGAAVAALLCARLLGAGYGLAMAVSAGLLLAGGLFFAPAAGALLSAGALILLLGIGSGALLTYYQVVIAESTPVASRGSALAIGGTGWALSHLVAPFSMGWLSDHLSLARAFELWALFTAALAVLLYLLSRRLLRAAR